MDSVSSLSDIEVLGSFQSTFFGKDPNYFVSLKWTPTESLIVADTVIKDKLAEGLEQTFRISHNALAK